MATLAVALVALLVASIVGWNAGRSALDEKIRDQVLSTRIDRAHHIEDYFSSLRTLLQSLASSPATVAAAISFDDGYDLLENRLAFESRAAFEPATNTSRRDAALRNAADESRRIPAAVATDGGEKPEQGDEASAGDVGAVAEDVVVEEAVVDELATLRRYYEDEFLERLADSTDDVVAFEDYFPDEAAVAYLQRAYIADSAAPVGEKYLVADALDGSNYSKRHAAFHLGMRKIVDEFGLYDLFLIEPQDLRIVYSVHKEADFATSLRSGPFSQSQLGAVARAVKADPLPGVTQITDFATYEPSYGAPAGFLATPLFGPDDEFIGVLAVQIPIERINQVMTVDKRWEDVGMGRTGEAYLVGSDRRMRSDSRRFLEDPSQWAEGAGPEADAVRRHGSTVLFQPAATEPVLEAFTPDEGVRITTNYLGEEVISAYAPIDVPGLDWAIITEITTEEAFASSADYRRLVIITAVALAALVTFLAVAMAERFVQPFLSLTQRAQAVVRLPADRPDTEPVAFGAAGEAVEVLAARLDELRQRRVDAAVAKEAHHERLLPTVLARRAAHGDMESIDTFTALTVASVDTSGVTADEWPRFVTAIEHSAQANDLEIVSIDGRRLVAACGLRQGHLDQVDRVVRFAARAMAECGPAARAGVATGPTAFGFVGVGVARGDLWGEAPYDANHRMLEADPGRICVGQTVMERLRPQTVAALPDDIVQVGVAHGDLAHVDDDPADAAVVGVR